MLFNNRFFTKSNLGHCSKNNQNMKKEVIQIKKQIEIKTVKTNNLTLFIPNRQIMLTTNKSK